MNDFSALSSDQVQFVTIGENADGQRVDNYLLTRLKGVPKSRIYRILRKGEVRVNKGRIKPDFRLTEGDILRIPPIRMDTRPADARKPGTRILEQIRQSILYEDKVLLALNKPAGLAVHGGSGLNYGAIEALRALRPDAPYLELVHRLDRETSGCLLIAKRRSALRSLHEALRQGQVDKHYLALVKGRWEGENMLVDAPLRKNQLKSGERMVFVDTQGKQASTLFSSLAVAATCSLMSVRLMTGRTHQIRVHAAHSGHPLLGDAKYGDPDANARIREQGLRRMGLHALSIRFQHPQTAEPLTLEAPLDGALTDMLRKTGLVYHGGI